MSDDKVPADKIVLVEKAPKNKRVTTQDRGSNFRGVSVNGRKYQVITFNTKVRYYLGTFEDETVAAIIFDFWQIQMYGLKGKTNF